MSALVATYARLRDFQKVADHLGIHRPGIRKVMSNASKHLLGGKEEDRFVKGTFTPVNPRWSALGAYVFGLIDKANFHGEGFTKKFTHQQTCDLHFTDPAILDQFVISASDPHYESVLTSRANH